MTAVSYFNDIRGQGLPVSEDMKGLAYLDNILALQVGNGSKVLRSDESGLWLGASKFVDAPFSIDMEGNLIATQATISGAITAATIDIGGADATSFHVDINGNIWSGHAAFASAPFKVSNAGAVTASNLTVTGGSITGADITLGGLNDVDGVINIKDASDNLIIKGDKLGHHYYNTDGQELVSISSGGWQLKDTAGSAIVTQVGNGLAIGNNVLFAWYDTGNALTAAVYMADDNEFMIANTNEADGDIIMLPNGELDVYGAIVSVTSGVGALGDIVTSGKMYSTGGYDPIVEINDELYSTWAPESPQYLVFYYGSGELKNGSHLVDLSHFEEPTEEWLFTKVAKDVSVFITPLGDSHLYAEKRGDFSFEIKTNGVDVPFSYFLVGKKVGYNTNSTRLGEQVIDAPISDKNKEKLFSFARRVDPTMKKKKDLLLRASKKINPKNKLNSRRNK